jgi:hypothetical protein
MSHLTTLECLTSNRKKKGGLNNRHGGVQNLYTMLRESLALLIVFDFAGKFATPARRHWFLEASYLWHPGILWRLLDVVS